MMSTPKAGIDRTNTDWYKDAVIYQVHVKAFQDSNDDGIGDFAGFMRRLDYIQSLGATAIWLMPFYVSPLRDDGYDIADYREINPAFGSKGDFRRFVTEAHRRGLRVITELVINHTSDQHPWFQRARSARPGSAARDYYVWSDDDTKFSGTRIIFNDTENSNWTWDAVAKQYYWHRFYAHQPDLNFDNPRVLQEVLRVMHYWLDMGVDALRLDAIPYLVERDGTNNENLPETHEILKKIRADLDAHYPDRMLLAEANQWPEDTRPYFGEGDECHMGFHFPLMPRIYMAVAQEDRHPISDIIRQTPDIPDSCQWAIFLRNHDELTLEMVTDRERDYLWQTYADDQRARINMGIRRRLAPLMQNDRRKIELLNFLLLSLPGTPILYYGDEIGMGDNYYFGDRDGVRTPMQWSPDRNGGFSRSDPQRLYLPLIQDTIYGYQAVNVESQQADRSSLLNWVRRMVSVRQAHQVFGRGTMTLLYPANRKIFAYVREYDGVSVLCVANLSRSAQAAEIDLSAFAGRVPVELTDRSPFPPVGELPYLFMLPGYGYYWFILADETAAPHWHVPVAPVLPEFVTLTARDGRLMSALSGREGRQLADVSLPKFLPLQRWFAGKDGALGQVEVTPLAEMPDGGVLTRIDLAQGVDRQSYFMPLAARWGEDHLVFGAPTLSVTLARLRHANRLGALIDGTADDATAMAWLGGLRDDLELPATDGGRVRFYGTKALRAIKEPGQPRLMTIEQSNASVAFGASLIMKFYRRVRPGIQPDIEMARFLRHRAGFTHTPALLGWVDHIPPEGPPTTLAAAFAFVANQGDAWTHVTEALGRDLEEYERAIHSGTEVADFAPALQLAPVLGARTAALHGALASDVDDPAFAPEPITRADLAAWGAELRAELADSFDRLAQAAGALGPEQAEMADMLLAARARFDAQADALAGMAPSGIRCRIHGDYHLGQVLVAQNELFIIDFEGEPARPLAARRAKASPLRDVAGMVRSFDYAARMAVDLRISLGGDGTLLQARSRAWHDDAVRAFQSAYDEAIAQSAPHAMEPALAQALRAAFMVQKAAYELRYELANRPAWVGLPLAGLIGLLGGSDHG